MEELLKGWLGVKERVGVGVGVTVGVDVGVSDGTAVGVGLGRVAVAVGSAAKTAQPWLESAKRRRETSVAARWCERA